MPEPEDATEESTSEVVTLNRSSNATIQIVTLSDGHDYVIAANECAAVSPTIIHAVGCRKCQA